MTSTFSMPFTTMGSSFDWNAVLNLSPLTKPESDFLMSVYLIMATGLFSTGLGVWFDANIFHLPSFLSLIGTMGCMWYIFGKAAADEYGTDKSSFVKRFGAYEFMSFLVGSGLTPLVTYAIYVNPATLMTAILGTVAIFACLSVASIFSKSRSFLYLGGFLFSSLTLMAWASLANLLFRSALLHSGLIFGGLLVYMGFVLFDTQLIIAEHKAGNRDVFKGVVQLYFDLIQMFVRILNILIQKEERKERRRRSD